MDEGVPVSDREPHTMTLSAQDDRDGRHTRVDDGCTDGGREGSRL